MGTYWITLKGCDDKTQFTVELGDQDTAFLQRIARMTQDLSEFGCQPTMTVTTEQPDD